MPIDLEKHSGRGDPSASAQPEFEALLQSQYELELHNQHRLGTGETVQTATCPSPVLCSLSTHCPLKLAEKFGVVLFCYILY